MRICEQKFTEMYQKSDTKHQLTLPSKMVLPKRIAKKQEAYCLEQNFQKCVELK